MDAAAPLGLCIQYPAADAGFAADAGGRLGKLGRGDYVPGTQLSSVMQGKCITFCKKLVEGFASNYAAVNLSGAGSWCSLGTETGLTDFHKIS